MRERIRQYHEKNRQVFLKEHSRMMHEYNFQCGDLVLVRNTCFDTDVGNKTKPRYIGPMIVIRKTKGGAYILAEMDGAVLHLPIAAFQCLPYHSRTLKIKVVAKAVGTEALKKILQEHKEDNDFKNSPDADL